MNEVRYQLDISFENPHSEKNEGFQNWYLTVTMHDSVSDLYLSKCYIT